LDVDQVGKLLFGRPCRLALALWIVQHAKGRFYQSEPPREVIRQSDLADELSRLVRLGMLEEERRDDARRIYYERTDSPLWSIIEAAADVIGPSALFACRCPGRQLIWHRTSAVVVCRLLTVATATARHKAASLS
jgi:hypothetical protein